MSHGASPSHPFFTSIQDRQRLSPDLLTFSRLVGQVVTIDYPTRPDGTPILPSGLKEYLRKRGLFLECYCALVIPSINHEPQSCRLVVCRTTKVVYAFCNTTPSVCGMRTNITAIAGSTRCYSSYQHWPTLSPGSMPPPPMAELLRRFRELQYPDTEVAPYFPGYLGEYVAFYHQGAMQLAGDFMDSSNEPLRLARPSLLPGTSLLASSRPRLLAPRGNLRYIEIDDMDHPSLRPPPASAPQQAFGMNSGPSRAATRVRRRPVNSINTIAGPSDLSGAATRLTPTMPVQHDEILIERLRGAGGLSKEQWEGLVVACQKCDRVFLRGKLADHVTRCLGMIEL